MTDRPQPEPGLVDEPTRDVRLPPLSDRPAPAPPSGLSAASAAPARPTGRAEPPLEEQPTDQLAHGTPRPRERTLAFSHPEMGRRPVGPIKVGPARRWQWVLLVVLPVLVIAGAAIALLLILRGA